MWQSRYEVPPVRAETACSGGAKLRNLSRSASASVLSVRESEAAYDCRNHPGSVRREWDTGLTTFHTTSALPSHISDRPLSKPAADRSLPNFCGAAEPFRIGSSSAKKITGCHPRTLKNEKRETAKTFRSGHGVSCWRWGSMHESYSVATGATASVTRGQVSKSTESGFFWSPRLARLG